MWQLFFPLQAFNALGRVRIPKWMSFRKNSKQPLIPLLIFGKLCCKFFIMDTKPSKIGGTMYGFRYEGQILGNTCIGFPRKGPFWGAMNLRNISKGGIQKCRVLIFLNTIVEKGYPRQGNESLFINFMLKKPFLKFQNLQHKFLEWMPPSPPL